MISAAIVLLYFYQQPAAAFIRVEKMMVKITLRRKPLMIGPTLIGLVIA